MRLLCKITYLLPSFAIAIALSACGGGSALTGNDKKASKAAGPDKEDDSADEPAEVAGAFLDDGTGATSKLGIAMKEGGAKVAANTSNMTVKYVPEPVDPKVPATEKALTTENAPPDSPWNVYVTMPSEYRKSGALSVRLVDGKKPRRGSVKTSALAPVSEGSDSLGGPGSSNQTSVKSSPNSKAPANGASASSTAPIVGGFARDMSVSPQPFMKKLNVVAFLEPLSTNNLAADAIAATLCDDAGEVSTQIPTLQMLTHATVDTAKECFKKMGDVTFIITLANRCAVVHTNKGYYVTKPSDALALLDTGAFARAYHCDDVTP